MKGGGCSACSGTMMHGGSLASERVNSFVSNPVKSYDFVSSEEAASSASSLNSVATHQTTGGGKRRSRRSHRGGAGSDFVSTLYSRGSIIAPEAGVAELSKNFTSEGNLVPFKELVSPTNSPLLSQQGGRRSRRRRSSKKNKRVQRRSSQRSRRNRRSQRK
jgi:hypothetical protein